MQMKEAAAVLASNTGAARLALVLRPSPLLSVQRWRRERHAEEDHGILADENNERREPPWICRSGRPADCRCAVGEFNASINSRSSGQVVYVHSSCHFHPPLDSMEGFYPFIYGYKVFEKTCRKYGTACVMHIFGGEEEQRQLEVEQRRKWMLRSSFSRCRVKVFITGEAEDADAADLAPPLHSTSPHFPLSQSFYKQAVQCWN